VHPVRALSVVLVAALGLVPFLPAEHVHETEVNGHSHVVVHQHLQLHGFDHPPGGPGGRGVFDHPDDPILTLSTVFIVPAQHAVAAPDLPLVATIQPRQSDAGAALIELIGWPIHGPPRPLPSLRGPPPPVL
jgi:hypothetical protein